MPPKVNILTVEFRSLLLPPVRVRLRAFQAVLRLRCAPPATPRVTPQCLTQCRSLHLYKTARTKTLLGQHKLMTFSGYEVSPRSQSQHKVNLVESEKNGAVIAADITLQELYDKYVGPGQMLYLAHSIPKAVAENFDRLQKENTVEECRNFAIMEPYSCIKKGSKEITLRPTKGYQLGELKCIMIRLSSPAAYFKISMDRAYQFVQAGSPVEFRIRLRGSTNKIEKKQAGPIEKWRWMHDHWPHLRPDFILKSMPEGASFLIDPVSDGYIVQFVVSLKATVMPTRDLNTRLWKVKDGVTRSTESGRQSQLPKFMREELAEQGLKDYSPRSGLPKAQALAGYTKDKSVAAWGFEEGEAPARDPAERLTNADYAARRERMKARKEWEESVRQRNAMLPPLGGLQLSYSEEQTLQAQESATQAQDGEKQDGHHDPAVEDSKSEAHESLRTEAAGPREGFDYMQSKTKGKPKARSAWQGRGRVK